MSISQGKIDSAPINNSDFPFPFQQWLAVLVDTLNINIANLQQAFNIIPVQGYTTAQIATLTDMPNGILIYDTDLDVYVGKQAGSLVKFTTTAYP